MLTHFEIKLKSWQEIINRFISYTDDNLEGQSVKIIDNSSQDSKWLECLLTPEISQYFREEPKIKVSALGGLGANNSLRIHMDGHNPPRADQHWAINIPIINCEDSIMYWYDNNYDIDIAVPTDNPKLVADNAQHLVPRWVGDPKIIDQWTIDSPAAVRVTVPHNVVNNSNRPRFLLSVRFQTELNPEI